MNTPVAAPVTTAAAAAAAAAAVKANAAAGTATARPARPNARIAVLPHAQQCPQGAGFQVRQGLLLIDKLPAQGLAIENGRDKACATCHAHVRDRAEALTPADEVEDDQFDSAQGLAAQSRLARCVKPRGAALVVELPRFSRNQA